MRWIVPVILCLAGQADAGAWPRAEGETFLSISAEADSLGTPDPYTALYLEYGLTRTLTLGLDAGRNTTGHSEALVFARRPLNRPGAALKWAAELGAGRIGGATVLRPGLSLGRAIRLGGQPGWAALDARADIDLATGRSDLSADYTLGLTVTNQARVILQIRSHDGLFDSTAARALAAMVIEHRPGRYLDIGMTARPADIRDIGLRLGIWRRF